MSRWREKQGGGWRSAQPVGHLVSHLLDPLIEQRAGMAIDLIASWAEIVGEPHASCTKPLKFDWSTNRRGTHEDGFDAATLIVACEPGKAVFFQHDSSRIIQRVNAWFGFGAVAKIRIVQQELRSSEPVEAQPPRLSENEARRADDLTAAVENERLREALHRMALGIARDKIAGRSQGSD